MSRIPNPIRKFGLILIPICLVALVGAVQAQPFGPPPGERGPQQMKEMIFERLDLNATQQEQMTQLHERHRQEMALRHEEMKAAHEALQAAIDSEEFDEAAVRQAADELGRLQTEMFVARAKMQQEVRQILTPEQFEQLTQLRNRHHRQMMDRPGGFGGHGHGPWDNGDEAGL